MKTNKATNTLSRVTNGLRLLAIGLLPLAGCGKLDSGAYAEPSVRLKPVESATDAAGSGGNSPTVSVATGGVGQLTGRVTFSGAKPNRAKIVSMGAAPKDKEVCGKMVDIFSEELMISDDNGVANVFIFLDKPPAGYQAEKPTEVLTFDQKGCIFLTHAMIFQTGQAINVLNGDPIPHNTHPNPVRNDLPNVLIKEGNRTGVAISAKKSEKEPFKVKCDFHDWMAAYMHVIDHPFGVVSGPDGKFKIDNLPAGKHEFRVWHERGEGAKPGGGFLNRKLAVQIKPGETTDVTIETKPSDFGY